MNTETIILKESSPLSLDRASRLLSDGEIGAVPTETVYGLAGDATNASAVEKIFRAKGRPPSDPLIVHVADRQHAECLAHFPDAARLLADAFWPGPLTLVLPKKSLIPDAVTSGGSTLALRVPSHPLMQKLLQTSGLALAAPSANPFGKISPTRPEHVLDGLSGKISFVLDGGPTGWGLESTILDVSGKEFWKLYRPGPLGVETLQEWLQKNVPGMVILLASDPLEASDCLPAPGMLSRHYSPRTPLKLVTSNEMAVLKRKRESGKGIALVETGLEPPDALSQPGCYRCASEGTLESAAANLYALLHHLDKENWQQLIFEKFPEEGLGAALNNRLQRASDS